MKLHHLISICLVALLFVACTPEKEIAYMTNIDKVPSAALSAATTQAGDFTIKPGDMLQINVSSTNSDAVKPFNKIQYVPTLGENATYGLGDYSVVYYLVDDDGNIDFPVLGKIHVANMTKRGIQEHIASLVCPRYLTEKPEVECRIQNFRVFCVGEFNHPGVVSASNGRLNLIEAIALSGDLTLQGERDNIMLIRTDATGSRYMKRINLNDANFMTMPEFELQQNDILYVTPNKYKKRSVWSASPMFTFGISMLGTAMSLITFVTVLAK